MTPSPSEKSVAGGPDFKLDRFQQEAIESIESGASVLVAAPTGSGKTVIAEYAVSRALGSGGKSFYTTPIKALSNQKFADFRTLHGEESVGLLTGDTSVNSDAQIVVMTTEVLRNMIYEGSTTLSGLSVVVLDEVHYLQDPYRGPVWEEVVLNLASEVRLVALSATVSNAEELGAWLSKVRGRTEVIVEHRRPVRLHQQLAVNDRFQGRVRLEPLLVKGRPNPTGDRFDQTRRPQSSPKLPRQRQKSRWGTPRRDDLIEILADSDRLPALWFIFSRAGCDEAARKAERDGIRLAGREEGERIRQIVQRHVAGLDVEDLDVLGYDAFLARLERGIGAHHAGMVPAFKEAVEELFREGLVRLVFATETLALGVNLPARSVVIEQLSKFRGDGHEILTASEFTQLTGRAGRRGLDSDGTAFVLWSPFVGFEAVAGLACSREFELRSAFRPNYNMAANLIRRMDRETARDLLGRSFAQFQIEASTTPVRRRRVERLERQFDRVLSVLANLGYLEGWSLTEKGERLARTYHESDLLVVEAVDAGLFDGLGPAELAALASCITYEHRSKLVPGEGHVESELVASRIEALSDVFSALEREEVSSGVPITRRPDSRFAEIARRWCSGVELAEVLDGQDFITPGDFVRNCKILGDLVRQIGTLAGDAGTRRSAARAAEQIRHGVVAAGSAMEIVVGEI